MKKGIRNIGLMRDLTEQACTQAVCPTPRCSWAHWFAAKRSPNHHGLAVGSIVIWKANRAASFHSEVS